MTVVHRVRLCSAGATSRAVSELAARLAALGGLGDREAYWLRLGVDEITANIWTHGYGGNAGTLDLSGGVEPGHVWICTEDDARPFDPIGQGDAEPAPATDPDRVGVGGFGLYLARSVLHGLAYERVRGRNRTLLTMFRPDVP